MDIKEISLKREEAINNVKYNLKRYAQLRLYPKTIEERVLSYTSSLITVSADENTKKVDDRMLVALADEEDDAEFVNKYDYLLSCLCEESSEYIFRIYFNDERIEYIKDENTNIYHELKNMYEIVACLDEDIDYDIEDYTAYKDYRLSMKHKDTWKVKQLALQYLKSARNGLLEEEVNEALNSLPGKEKQYVMNYISDESINYSSYEYRIVLRGLLLFAYYFEKIEFGKEELKEALRKSGSGWKKIYNNIK